MPLTVAKRPGEDRYTIAAGGNSRLRILKHLAEETGDEAFAVVMCQFEPWSTECQVLANHLIENDIRGSILFGDKASAIVAWRELYEDANPDEAPLSQRMLAERLIAAGYRIPQSLLSRLVFAAVLYWQHDPHWIDDGLGGAGNILVYNNGNHRRMDGTYYMHQPGAGFGSAYSDLLELELPLFDSSRSLTSSMRNIG